MWIIAYCKTSKTCIGTLNFTYMNLPFVDHEDLLIVCLSIAVRTQCRGTLVVIQTLFVYWMSILCLITMMTSKRSGIDSVKENVWPWVFQ